MRLRLFIILCALISISAAQSEDFLQRWGQSLETWKNLNPYAYNYTIFFESWTGFGQITQIRVADNQVVRREFEAWEKYLTPTSDRRTIEQWIETKPEEIGSHPSGFKALTMEQIYEKCKQDIAALNLQENDVFFEVDERGILKQCQYYPHFCADDCMFGTVLKELVIENPMTLLNTRLFWKLPSSKFHYRQ